MKFEKFMKENVDVWLYPLITTLLTLILAFFNIYFSIFGLILTIVALYISIESYNKRNSYLKNYVDKLEITFEEFTKNAIFSMPFPIFIVNMDRKLTWYNSRFKELFSEDSSMVDRSLSELLPNFKSKFIKDENCFDCEHKSKTYTVYQRGIVVGKEKLFLFYMVDITGETEMKKAYYSEKLNIMNIHIDNFDEVKAQTDSEKRPIVFAEIDRIITSYMHENGGFIKKIENDKYSVVALSKNIENMKNDKFSFIEKVRDVKQGNRIQATLSIGVGTNEQTPRDIEKAANAALEIALGRGGDQVVIKNREVLEYFGGKNRATEKRTKVKARVIAHALGQLIDKSTEVFVMGHKNPDMDSFGSALGLMYAVIRRKKKAHLVLAEVTPAIKNIYNMSIETIEGFKEMIISPDEAYRLIKPSSLIIVTDNHRKNSTEEPRLFEISSNVVVIDHHRRGRDYIDNATLSYTEPYASSASELVTEMLMYMDDEVYINKSVADGLLAGITVDTKNFFYQTGVRTFEAASVLKRNGADSMVVKQLFKDDLEIIRYKSEIISKAIMFKEKFIVGVFDQDIDGSTLIASQAADELLNIDGVMASFVLTRSKGLTHVSARSLGDVSVQLIMEKVGGGGHLTAAATQIDRNIEESIVLIEKAIESYLKEENL